MDGILWMIGVSTTVCQNGAIIHPNPSGGTSPQPHLSRLSALMEGVVEPLVLWRLVQDNIEPRHVRKVSKTLLRRFCANVAFVGLAVRFVNITYVSYSLHPFLHNAIWRRFFRLILYFFRAAYLVDLFHPTHPDLKVFYEAFIKCLHQVVSSLRSFTRHKNN